jgi:A/G-specific adenine glycosylase
VTAFQRRLLSWYRRHGRATLPWRRNRTPYRTLVSEFMLVQTQVDRVVPKFEAFLDRFPDLPALAGATTAEVLRAWRGLGYNSRAVRLHRLARLLCERNDGALPSDSDALRDLPGVGAYTAAAIRAFAFNLDDVPVDTNVRRIVERVYFGIDRGTGVAPSQIDARAVAILPSGRAHDWGSALMDLGATICTARAPKCLACPLRGDCKAAPVDAPALHRLRAARAKRGTAREPLPFERTTRYARGRIVERLRDLPPGQRISLLDLARELAPAIPGRGLDDVRGLIAALERDGLITDDGTSVALRE